MSKRKPRNKRKKIAIVLLLSSIALSLALLSFGIFLRGKYIPGKHAFQMAEIVGYSDLMFLLGWSIWFFVKIKIHPSLSLKERLKGLLAWPIFILVMPLLTYWGSAMSVGYVLHLYSKTNSIIFETIRSKEDNAVRYEVVSNCVVLTGDTLLHPQEVCGLRRQDWEIVKPYMKIKLFGTSSPWGFYANKYRLLSSKN